MDQFGFPVGRAGRPAASGLEDCSAGPAVVGFSVHQVSRGFFVLGLVGGAWMSTLVKWLLARFKSCGLACCVRRV